MNIGHFIVIEGTDGAGKGTQLGLLKEKLQNLNTKFQIIEFPRYGDNPYAKLVEGYLRGDLGKVEDLNPRMITLMYAGDRTLAKDLINGWLNEGDLVIAGRYLHSNIAYSLAKLPEDQKQEFMDWNYDLEYNTNGIPKEELVILLYVDPEVAQKNIEQKGDRAYMGGKGKDVHEADLEYQKAVAEAYLYLSKKQPHWMVIDCAPEGKMRTPDEIHEQIMEVLKEKGIF